MALDYHFFFFFGRRGDWVTPGSALGGAWGTVCGAGGQSRVCNM